MRALALIINLRHAAEHHKRTCSEPCNISLISLRQTASTLKDKLEPGEQDEADALTADWPL